MAVIVIEGYMYCRTVNCRAGMRILDVISMPRHDKGRLWSATPGMPPPSRVLYVQAEVLVCHITWLKRSCSRAEYIWDCGCLKLLLPAGKKNRSSAGWQKTSQIAPSLASSQNKVAESERAVLKHTVFHIVCSSNEGWRVRRQGTLKQFGRMQYSSRWSHAVTCIKDKKQTEQTGKSPVTCHLENSTLQSVSTTFSVVYWA